MRDVLPSILPWWRAGQSVAVATVVATWKSAPQPAGAVMAVGPTGEVFGSVSGGCVESAVLGLAQDALTGSRPVLQRYGVSDGEALYAGLTCGGVLDVFVERVNQESFPELEMVAADVQAGRPVAIATLIAHPDPTRIGRRLVVGASVSGGSLGSDHFDRIVGDDVAGLLAAGQTTTLSYGPEGQRLDAAATVFVAAHAPPPRMIIFGSVDFASALAQMTRFLGYHVTVCDARETFTTRARFPDAHEVVVEWPHRYLAAEAAHGRVDRRTVLAVLTHDPKFDGPVLEVALRLPEVAYVGAMGSRRTHEDRLRRLREVGLTPRELSRLSSPIGLDLGARTSEETAVSIAAEILALRSAGSGARLSRTDGPIHHPIDHPNDS